MTLETAHDLINLHMAAEGEANAGADITALLHDWGNPDARSRLTELIYPELRRLAAARLRWERSGHTLQPTALVGEVFLQLVKTDRLDCRNRAHFFAVVSEKMRRILVDSARRRLSLKRGANYGFKCLEPDNIAARDCFHQWLEIDNLLDELEKVNPRVGTAFKLHYFVGLTFDQVGEALGINVRTAKRDCNVARAWLYASVQSRKAKHDGRHSTKQD